MNNQAIWAKDLDFAVLWATSPALLVGELSDWKAEHPGAAVLDIFPPVWDGEAFAIIIVLQIPEATAQ